MYSVLPVVVIKTFWAFFLLGLFPLKPAKCLFLHSLHTSVTMERLQRSPGEVCIRKYDLENSNQRWGVKRSVPAAAAM